VVNFKGAAYVTLCNDSGKKTVIFIH